MLYPNLNKSIKKYLCAKLTTALNVGDMDMDFLDYCYDPYDFEIAPEDMNDMAFIELCSAEARRIIDKWNSD